MNTQDLAIRISDLSSFEGYQFDCQPIPGDVDVLQVTVGDYQEIPVFLSVTDTQVLCITYLFTEGEVIATSRVDGGDVGAKHTYAPVCFLKGW